MTTSSDLDPANPDDIGRHLLESLTHRRQIPPISDGRPDFDAASAYRVTEAVRRRREARGETVVGRKIGFTNRTIWAEYGVHGPIWGYVYDTTLHRLADLTGPLAIGHLVEPRIEPEIAFGLALAPEAGMDERELLSCIAWAAHGFEIVQSLYPGWRFTAPDTIAAFGLHGALCLGPARPVTTAESEPWLASLAGFEIGLACDGRPEDRGHAGNVLGGGPLTALRHLVDLLGSGVASAEEAGPALRAGEIVTTGTVTRAFPVRPGETWTTEVTGLPLAGIAITFA